MYPAPKPAMPQKAPHWHRHPPRISNPSMSFGLELADGECVDIRGWGSSEPNHGERIYIRRRKCSLSRVDLGPCDAVKYLLLDVRRNAKKEILTGLNGCPPLSLSPPPFLLPLLVLCICMPALSPAQFHPPPYL